jgi:hypothetical protein
MAKESMQTSEAELKAVAKAIGSSLKRSGHSVPHSIMLHAVAAALDKRDWHKLKASLTNTTSIETSIAAQQPTPPTYNARTWFFLRLAWAIGRPLPNLPASDEEALAEALQVCGAEHSGVLRWSGWNMPGTLNVQTSKVDVGDFSPSNAKRPGEFLLNLKEVGQVSIEVFFSENEGTWVTSSKGVADFIALLEHRVPDERIRGVTPVVDSKATARGPYVNAEFWTDDRVFEVEFDARPYLQQASDDELAGIIEVGFRGDYETDNIAQYVSTEGLSVELNEAFDYIGAMQKSKLKDPPGFEVAVDVNQYLKWLDEQRPLVLARAVCEHLGIRAVEAEEPEIAGRWDWVDDEGNASDASLESQDAAYLDAYRKLGLFQQALSGQIF